MAGVALAPAMEMARRAGRFLRGLAGLDSSSPGGLPLVPPDPVLAGARFQPLAGLLPHARPIERLGGLSPAVQAAMRSGPTTQTPALLVTPGPDVPPAWSVGFAWLDHLDLSGSPGDLAMAQGAVAAWLARSGSQGEEEPVELMALRLARLAARLSDIAPGLEPAGRALLARRIEADLARLRGARLPAGLAQWRVLVAAVAVARALPGALAGEAEAALTAALGACGARLIETGGLAPAQLQAVAADLDALATVEGEADTGTYGQGGDPLSGLLPRLVRALQVVTRSDGTMADFGGGPGDPVLCGAFAMMPVLAEDGGAASLMGAGYARAADGPLDVWLGLAPGLCAAPLEIVADGVPLLVTGRHRSGAPLFQLARHRGQSLATSPEGRLHVRLRATATGQCLEAVAKGSQPVMTRRLELMAGGACLKVSEALYHGPGDPPPEGVLVSLYCPSGVRAVESRDRQSVILATDGGHAWRVRGKALDFQCRTALYEADRGSGVAPGTLISGTGVGSRTGNITELGWELVREA